MATDTLSRLRPQAREHDRTIALHRYWDRIGLFAVLILAAILNFWQLGRQGYSNTYYAAAVKSMTQNWHAFFFNSLDPAGFVTIDKPPLGFWFQVLSAKIFGFNSVSLMLPQALAGVASVAVLYFLVRRHFGVVAGLISALALAITPINVVSNRNNIIDSTLVLAVLLGAWAVMRAVETGKLRWLVLCAVFVGLGFNIKMLQAFLVLPAFGLVYLVGAHVGWGKRLLHLVAATVVLLLVSFSWVTAVDLTPASQRPWVGSTTDNSELSLAIGYNGLQRLTGNTSVGGRNNRPTGANSSAFTQLNTGTTRPKATGAGTGAANPGGNAPPGSAVVPGGNGGGPGGVGENGPTGPLRLLDAQLGSQIGWLLTIAVLGFFAAVWQTRRRFPLSNRQSMLVMWGTWLLTMAVFFSIAGFFHTYYLVMVAPAIAALAGIGLVSLWTMYRQAGGRLWFLLPISLVASTLVEAHVLTDYPSWSSWLSPLIIGLAVAGALILAFLRLRPVFGIRLIMPAMLLGIVALLAAPAVWSVETVQAADSGLTPRAGPAGTSTGFGGGGPGGFRFADGNSNGTPTGGQPGASGGNRGFFPPQGGGRGFGSLNPAGWLRGGGNGGPGGDTVNKQLLSYLEKNQGNATYLFATTSAGTAEPYIIATGKAVMAMGGFLGSDPILTSTKVAALVKVGTVRFFLMNGGGGFGAPGGDSAGGASSWVQANCSVVPASKYSFTATTATSGDFGGSALYDCGGVK